MFKGVSLCIPAVGILYLGSFNSFHYSPLLLYFPPLLLQQLSIHILLSSTFTDVMFYDIIHIYFFFSTGAWTQGRHLKPHHQPYFCEGFFEIQSHKLFARAGFQLWSSWVGRIIGVSHKHTAFLSFFLTLGVELRTSCLLGRSSITWSMLPALFPYYLWNKSHVYALVGGPGLRASNLHFPCRWDDRHAPPPPANG
jgi:hypothetical protein